MIRCNLDKILEVKGITKYKLSKSTGISAHALKNLAENKTASINFEVLSKICNELDITVGELLENVKEDTDNKEKVEE